MNKYGKNITTIFRKLEKVEVKISNFKNHLRFSLRCLNKGLLPVSLRLKNLIRTQKGRDIIYKTERKLLNERIGNINGTIQCYEHERCMYQHELKELIYEEMWTLCMTEISRVKELRYKVVMKRQISKFNKLLQLKNHKDQNQGGCSNHQNGHSNQDGLEMTNITPKKWMINLSSTPLLRKKNGPNFVVTPIDHPMGSKTAIETAFQSLDSNTAEELRADIYRV